MGLGGNRSPEINDQITVALWPGDLVDINYVSLDPPDPSMALHRK